MLLMLSITYAATAQEPKLFVAKALSVYKLNSTTNKFEFSYKKEGFTAITYGDNYVQVAEAPELRFTLYGEVTKSEDADAEYFVQRGYTHKGQDMTTSTSYGKKMKYINVGFRIGSTMFIYNIRLTGE